MSGPTRTLVLKLELEIQIETDSWVSVDELAGVPYEDIVMRVPDKVRLEEFGGYINEDDNWYCHEVVRAQLIE